MLIRTPLVLLTSIAVAILWGCNSDSSATLPDSDFFVNDGQAFSMRVGETAAIQSPSAVNVVRFSGVLDDNRCPENVQCMDAGFATIVLSVQSALAVNEVQIQVPPSGEAQVVVEELTIDVLELRPAAQEGVEINLLDYTVALRVRQTGELGVS